jgi:hypothetical protein
MSVGPVGLSVHLDSPSPTPLRSSSRPQNRHDLGKNVQGKLNCGRADQRGIRQRQLVGTAAQLRAPPVADLVRQAPGGTGSGTPKFTGLAVAALAMAPGRPRWATSTG